MSILGRKAQGTPETSMCSFCSYLSHSNITPLVLVGGGLCLFIVIKWKDVELLFVKAGEVFCTVILVIVFVVVLFA